MPDSPTRKFVKALIVKAKALRDKQDFDHERAVYKSLCEQINKLNAELSEEDEGSILDNWSQ